MKVTTEVTSHDLRDQINENMSDSNKVALIKGLIEENQHLITTRCDNPDSERNGVCSGMKDVEYGVGGVVIVTH